MKDPDSEMLSMFKRPLALLLCFLMLTLPLAGCLNSGTDPATTDDDLVLGELPDDWPTYYVPSASDLPACPGPNDANLGKLYYVEDVADFQACTSTGWSSVDTSGLTNHPPEVSVRLNTNDDYSSGGDPNEPWMYRAFMQWSANDPEGTAVSVGVDHDRDGVVDLALPAAEGVDAGTTNQMIEIPWNGTLFANRWTGWSGSCGLMVYRMFDVIAEDATGMTTVHTVITDAVQEVGNARIYWEDDIDSVEAIFPTLSSDDIDWLSGDLPGSPCTWTPMAVYTTTFDATSGAITGTTATNDVLADLMLTYTTGSGLGLPDVAVSVSVDGGAFMPCAELVAATSQSTDCAFTWLFGGNKNQISVGNGIRIFENGQDLCATSTGCSVEWKVDVFQQGQMTSANPGNWDPSDSGYTFDVVDHADAPSTATDDGLFDLTMTQGSDINLATMRLVLKIEGTYHECTPSSSVCDKVASNGGSSMTASNVLSIVETGADLCSGSCTIEYWVSNVLDRTTLAKGIVTVS